MWKIPPDWEYTDLWVGGGTGPTVDFYSYGLKGQDPVVLTGGYAQGLEEYKQYLEGEGFTVESEEAVTIDGKSEFKLLVQDASKGYKEYAYYVPNPFNVPQILRGPALESSAEFDNCEPEIFQQMVESATLYGGMRPPDDWDAEPTRGGSSGALISCPSNLLSTDAELIERHEDWWEKLEDPGPYDDYPDQPVCGHIRSVFDNGQSAESWDDYDNPCSYCSFFNQDGERGLRGTMMYVLGYTEGPCSEESP